MKRLLKILLGLAAALVVLLVLAAVLLPLMYDKEDLKQAISSQVHERTGRDLSIDGALDFSVFPWLAVEVGDLSLSNASGFGDQPFARIGQARVGVALIPLFRKQIVVDTVTLHGLELALTVNARGQNNWDDLADGGASDESTQSEGGLLSSKRVAGLNISDARIDFQDQQAGMHYRLSDFSMQTGALGEGEPVPLELSTLMEDLATGARAGIKLATTAAIDLPAEQYTFDDFELDLSIESEQAGTEKQTIQVRAPRVGANLAAQTLSVDSFSVELATLRAEGSLTAQNILDGPVFGGHLKSSEFSPIELMQALNLEPPVTADSDVLRRAGFSTSFSGNDSQLKLPDLKLDLDQSQVAGEVNIQNFDQPKISFELIVDEIDLDRYLEPGSEQDQASNVAIPQEELQGRDFQGRLKIGKMRLAGLEFNQAELGVIVRKGKLRLNPLQAEFYGGTYQGDISLDSSGAAPVLSLDEKIDSITFQRMVADLMDTESLSGIAQGHLRLTGRGTDSDQVLQNLNGELGLTLSEGALEGINIWYEIRRGMARYKGLEEPPAEPARTVFSRMQMAATVADGVLTTRELIGELPFLTLRGNGAIDLGQSLVDLGLVAEVRNAPELANDPLAADLRGKSLPFRVTGSLNEPSVSVDWEALLKSEAAGLLLDRLGLAPTAPPEEAEQTDAEAGQEPASSEDQVKKAAQGTLFDLLRGKDKDKDKDDSGR